MGKNKDLLVICLAPDGKPSRVEIMEGDSAANLFRVEHGSAGSSFPGFNVPTPLRCLREAPTERLMPAVEHLPTLNKNAMITDFAAAIAELFSLSTPRGFTDSQEKQFQRCCFELVSELRETLGKSPAELKNFLNLLAIVADKKPTLNSFSVSLAEILATRNPEADRHVLLLFQDVLFGALEWKKRQPAVGTPEYWTDKAKQDKNANQPVYLDLVEPDAHYKRVAHRETSDRINHALLKAENSSEGGQSGGSIDAFTGQPAALQDKFPSPKIAELGNLKLFSVNTNEVRALVRYRLQGSEAFPIAKPLAQKMNDALLHLAGEKRRGTTCRAIPSAHPNKRDLLVAYLEGEPEFREQMAEMFGGEASAFSDADFEAIAKPVIQMLEGKAAANPNLNVRLLAFCSIDKGRKQISLNRCFRVLDVIRAAKDWQPAPEIPPTSQCGFTTGPRNSPFSAPILLLVRSNSRPHSTGFGAPTSKAVSLSTFSGRCPPVTPTTCSSRIRRCLGAKPSWPWAFSSNV